jgi:6-phosphogluconolactonase
VVCDKGTDEIHCFSFDGRLELVSTFRTEPSAGPRHLAFDPTSRLAFTTFEFASEIASFSFDGTSFAQLDRLTTLAGPLEPPRVNEPADVRVHPLGRFVYVNNRGEDSLAWFGYEADGRLRRIGHVPLAPSIHPGLAARSFCFDETGALLFAADRPANRLRAYAVDAASGTPSPVAELEIINPASVAVLRARPEPSTIGERS